MRSRAATSSRQVGHRYRRSRMRRSFSIVLVLGVLWLAADMPRFARGTKSRAGRGRQVRRAAGRAGHRPSRRQQGRAGKHAAGVRVGRQSRRRSGRARLLSLGRRRAGRVSRRRSRPHDQCRASCGAATRSSSPARAWPSCKRSTPAVGSSRSSPARAFPRWTRRSTRSRPAR